MDAGILSGGLQMNTRSIRFAALVAVLGLVIINNPAAAQTFVTPSPNTNIIGVTPKQENVPDLQMKQQQEPSCVGRPGNESYIICGYNDLRASDLPDKQGDSWIGVSMSADKGKTWLSRLSPGFKGHITDPLIHPVINPAAKVFAADPSFVAIPGNSPGLAILNYIVGERGTSNSVLAIQRWVEFPQEDQDYWKAELPVRVIADSFTDGGFIDKPAFFYLVDELSQQSTITQSIIVEGEIEPVTVTTPSGTLIVVYTVFLENSSSSQLLMRTSGDNGVGWSNAIPLSTL